MLEHVLRAAEVNWEYANKLVADIPEEKMCLQPAPGMNHAAWVLGHLAFVFDSMNRVFGHPGTTAPDRLELFKVGSEPTSDPSRYPSKKDLMEEYERNYRRMAESVRTATPQVLAQEFPNPRLKHLLPTIGVAMVHVLCTHHGLHLGQLSAWRRALGMSHVL